MPQIHVLEQVDSTSRYAKDLARAGKLDVWDAVVAYEQTAGYGRQGHRWKSPRGNLYVSFRLPDEPPFDGPQAPLALSAVYCRVLSSLGFPVRIKWPNDLALLINGRYCKIAGTLLEKRGGVLIAGTGINITEAPGAAELRTGAQLPAGTLQNCRERNDTVIDPPALWQAIEKELTHLDLVSFEKVWAREADRLLLWKGKSVTLTEEALRITGTLQGINEEGALLIAESGRVHTLFSGSLALV